MSLHPLYASLAVFISRFCTKKVGASPCDSLGRDDDIPEAPLNLEVLESKAPGLGHGSRSSRRGDRRCGFFAPPAPTARYRAASGAHFARNESPLYHCFAMPFEIVGSPTSATSGGKIGPDAMKAVPCLIRQTFAASLKFKTAPAHFGRNCPPFLNFSFNSVERRAT